MSVASQTGASTDISIAIIGNPNTGKTTLFNALTGLTHKVGNYPGVTVERRSGRMRLPGSVVELIDLPGTYSLAARSPDERIAVDTLLDDTSERPRALIVVVDASNLERNLYLISQLREFGVPLVVALNMIDSAQRRGLAVDPQALSQALELPVVAVRADRGHGVDALKVAIEQLLLAPSPPAGTDARSLRDKYRQSLTSEEIESRFRWAKSIAQRCVARPTTPPRTVTQRLDALLTHRIGGSLILLVTLAVVFQAIYRWAAPLMSTIETGFDWLGGLVSGALPKGPLQSLIVDGVIGGTGGVIVFLPQILILFLFLGILEDCGYMARAAFLMDRVLARVGLSGKSVIPLLSSFACAVPGVMSARVIEDRRDRLATILVAPLMSCSARLPVYVLMIGAFVPAQQLWGGWLSLQGVLLFAAHLIGVVVAIPVLWVIKRFLLRGPTPPFVMELPDYQWPAWRSVVDRLLTRAQAFLKRAGSVIVCVAIVVWALSYFPRPAAIAAKYDQLRTNAVSDLERTALDSQEAAEYVAQSYFARLGHGIEPFVRPLGWDWRIGMAVAASFPAREVVIATIGTVFGLGQDLNETSEGLTEALRTARRDDGQLLFTLPVAVSLVVFFALCCQCGATLAVMRRETGSWGWPLLAFVYMTSLAWLGAWLSAMLCQAWMS